MAYTPLPNPWTGIPLVGPLIDAIQTFLATPPTPTLSPGGENTVTQTAHGFSVGNVLYYTGTAYALAKADVSSTSEAVGVVASVTNANTFVLQTSGYVTSLAGLTAGSIYFLSDVTAGLLTTTEPVTVGHVSKPLFVAASTTTGYLFVMRGFVIPSPYTPPPPNDIGLIVALG